MEKKYLEEEYNSRINRVFDYIENNLTKDLSLEELANVANFSPFHFHRIFGSVVGETLFQFIQRIRIEKAASMLISDPKRSISEIAYSYGFSGPASFARSFKEKFGMSASDYRSEIYNKNSNTGKTKSKISKQESNKNKPDSNNSKVPDNLTWYFCGDYINIQKWRLKRINEKQVQVEVKELEEMNVAYVRHIGPYEGDEDLFERLNLKLFNWAGPRGLLKLPETKGLAVYHDDPKITEKSKLRTSVCITVPEDTKVDGEIGKMKISGGKYAVAKFELKGDEYGQAWGLVYGSWMPQSGYQPDDGPGFELYHNNPKDHPEGKCIVSICVPVKPL